jgi:glyceraldehyde-3-phosphate dehydrogenase (EC 1.2.1.12)
MVKVFLNGYGTIGRRIAYALANDKEIEFLGVGKYSIDDRAKEARDLGLNILYQRIRCKSSKQQGSWCRVA